MSTLISFNFLTQSQDSSINNNNNNDVMLVLGRWIVALFFSKVSLSSAVMLVLEDLFCSLKSISSLKERGPQMQ